MKKTNQRTLVAAAVLLAVFALFTVAVCTVDVQFAGPDGSQVGFATVNTAFHTCTGVHLSLYVLTDWLGLVPLAIAFTFALFGLFQWIRRRSLRRVDRSILLLGVFYLLVMAAYLLFEKFAVNFRPIRIDGYLEASYPSSTTLLVLSICPTAMLQWHARIRKRILRRAGEGLLAVFCAFMVTARLLCGVHWLTDIVGGMLLSAVLVVLYAAVCGLPGGELVPIRTE